MLCALGIAFSMSTKVSASNNTQRIWGNDRYATAIEISKNDWADGSEYAVLANGENFPDALSAAPLAKKYNAPILLNPSVTLDSRVEDELKRLGVKQIFIVGGSAVLSDTVKSKLEQLNIKTTRLWGQNRYETSIKIAEQLGFSGQVAVANGEGFADALSISPIAAQKSMPVILTPPNTLPDATAKYIKNNKITKTYIIGENDVVGDNIANSFPNYERIWGSSKYDTNIAVLNKFKKDLNLSNIYLANGENFPDALAGSALAAKNSSAIVLANADAGQTTKDFMFSNISSKCKTNVLGGNGVIPNGLIDDILNHVGNTRGNLSLGATAAKQREWIYYVDAHGRLCKCKEDGSSDTVLIDFREQSGEHGLEAYSINVVGDWIYYSSSDGIYKIKTDGSSSAKIIDESNTSTIIVIGDIIYYSTVSDEDNQIHLCKVNTDGSGKTILGKDNSMSGLNIAGDWAYYVNYHDGQRIHKIKLDGSDATRMKDDNSILQVIIDNGFMYYLTVASGIYKMNIDTLETTCIVDSSMVNTGMAIPKFNIANNWIYYSSKDGGLCKIKTDGSGNVKIIDANSLKTPISGGHIITVSNIVGDWVFYYCSVYTSEDIIDYLYKAKIDGSENKPLY